MAVSCLSSTVLHRLSLLLPLPFADSWRLPLSFPVFSDLTVMTVQFDMQFHATWQRITYNLSSIQQRSVNAEPFTSHRASPFLKCALRCLPPQLHPAAAAAVRCPLTVAAANTRPTRRRPCRWGDDPPQCRPAAPRRCRGGQEQPGRRRATPGASQSSPTRREWRPNGRPVSTHHVLSLTLWDWRRKV